MCYTDSDIIYKIIHTNNNHLSIYLNINYLILISYIQIHKDILFKMSLMGKIICKFQILYPCIALIQDIISHIFFNINSIQINILHNYSEYHSLNIFLDNLGTND